MEHQAIERLEIKTVEQRYLSILEREFHQPPRVAQALLDEARACLLGNDGHLKQGQIRVILALRNAPAGRRLAETPLTEVVWTIDAGLEDREVLRRYGPTALRRTRIVRLVDEALDQDGVATQEDLAHALHVSVRTIKRDCADLQAAGLAIPTRGNLHGIGRGQTHKAQIVGRWLRGETYDQIALHTRHAPSSIQRYVQTFVRVVYLHRLGFTDGEAGSLLGVGVSLVTQYLAIQRENDEPGCRQRLEEHLQRLQRAETGGERKKGAQ